MRLRAIPALMLAAIACTSNVATKDTATKSADSTAPPRDIGVIPQHRRAAESLQPGGLARVGGVVKPTGAAESLQPGGWVGGWVGGPGGWVLVGSGAGSWGHFATVRTWQHSRLVTQQSVTQSKDPTTAYRCCCSMAPRWRAAPGTWSARRCRLTPTGTS